MTQFACANESLSEYEVPTELFDDLSSGEDSNAADPTSTNTTYIEVAELEEAVPESLILAGREMTNQRNARSIASEVLGMGLNVVVYEAGKKSPTERNWQTRPLAPGEVDARVPPSSNLGLLMWDGLVDVDLDCPQAQFLAPMLLPATDFKFGKRSTPESHWLYRSTPSKKLGLDDPVSKGRIVDVLSSMNRGGVQSLFYGTHPKGEFVDLVRPLGTPAVADHAELNRRIRILASLVLVMRYMPKPYDRNDLVVVYRWLMPLAGIDLAEALIAVAMSKGDVDREELRAALSAAMVSPLEAKPPLPSQVVSAIFGWCSVARDTASSKEKTSTSKATAIVTRLDTVRPQSTKWLWPGRIPFGKITVIHGDPGLSKSTLTADLAARLSTGRNMPFETLAAPPSGEVIIANAEDGLADTTVPRLLRAGADLERIINFEGVRAPNGVETSLRLGDHVDTIEQLITGMGEENVLLIVDPINAFLGGKIKSHVDQDMRSVLAPLSAMADRTGAAIVIVGHLLRSDASNAISKVGGSTGLIGAARAGFLVAEDPNDEELRVFAPVKQNLARMAASLQYRLVSEHAEDVPRIEWIGESPLTANQLIRPVNSRDETSALEAAKEFVMQFLADGPRKTEDLNTAGVAAGHSKQTLRRASEELTQGRKFGFQTAWYRRLHNDSRIPHEVDPAFCPPWEVDNVAVS